MCVCVLELVGVCVYRVGDRIGVTALGISLLSFDSKLSFMVPVMNFAPPSPMSLQCSCVGVDLGV